MAQETTGLIKSTWKGERPPFAILVIVFFYTIIVLGFLSIIFGPSPSEYENPMGQAFLVDKALFNIVISALFFPLTVFLYVSAYRSCNRLDSTTGILVLLLFAFMYASSLVTNINWILQ